MIVKACDSCKKLNTEMGELLKVQEPKIGETYDANRDCYGGNLKRTAVFVYGNVKNNLQVARPYIELCRGCTSRVVSDAISELE